MSTAFDRGIVLLQQGRYDLADREFRRELSEDPDNPMVHAWLALCLSQRDEDKEALREADEAVRTGPDLAFCHYVRGVALNALDRQAEAEAAALEAIRLDPDDADYPGLLASIAMGRRRWSEALAAAERGLALDPEHAGCMNLRAMALVQLGRKAEAAAALGSALADDPENAVTHANQGWALLHRGEHVKALDHFRESLRLDPDLEWARAGMIEALKARFAIYRVMLAFFLWMGRQSRVAQWVVILGFIFGRKILADLQERYPGLAPFITPILALSFGFLLMTWISSPLFNLALRFNKFGRMALSREQKVESSWVGGCFLLAASAFAVNLVTGNALAFLAMSYFGLLLLPLAMTFHQSRPGPRRLAAAYTGGLAVVGVLPVGMIVMGPADPLAGLTSPGDLVQIFVLGAILSTWIPSLVGGLGGPR